MSKDHYHTEYDHSMSIGNSIDVQVNSWDCQIKADIVVSEYESVRLWGQVKTCNGQPVANALLKLLKIVHGGGNCEYQGVAHTISDCKGFYQFDLSPKEIGCSYKILVSKANAGCEGTLCYQGRCTSCAYHKLPYQGCNTWHAAYECRPFSKNCNCQ